MIFRVFKDGNCWGAVFFVEGNEVARVYWPGCKTRRGATTIARQEMEMMQ
jgi:hypothetical protein